VTSRFCHERQEPSNQQPASQDGSADGEEEVGVVKLVPAPAGSEWMWSMLLTHPGPAFKQPTNGRCERSGQVARCWNAFRDWFGIEDGPEEVR